MAPTTNDNVSASFQLDVKFVFECFDVDTNNSTGFKNTIRMHLVDNILKNMSFDPIFDVDIDFNDKELTQENLKIYEDSRLDESNIIHNLKEKLVEKKLIRGYEKDEKNTILFSGLPYMLDKEYFNNAFILHDESENIKDFNQILLEMLNHDSKSAQTDMMPNLLQRKTINSKDDSRLQLNNKWARFANIFKSQPKDLIKEYFGEQVTLYYSFIGVLISFLWIVVIAGIAVFVLGAIDKFVLFLLIFMKYSGDFLEFYL